MASIAGTSASGNSRERSRALRSWRMGASPAVTSWESRPGISMSSRPLRGGFLRRDRREGVAVDLELRVGELLDELADLAQLDRQLRVQGVGAGQHVLERLVAQLDGGVLHRDQVLDLVVQALPDHPPAAGVRRVEQRGDEPVALVEVGLPVERVVLVGPRDVPDGGTREGHRGVAGRLGAQPELGVVPLDEQRQARGRSRRSDLARDQAHEPAVEVDVDRAGAASGRSAGCGPRSPSR